MTVINQYYLEHKDLPKHFTCQFDNASCNKNGLMFGFLALYVLHGIFETVKIRYLMEHHAHDIYDAFHGIHTKVLRRAPCNVCVTHLALPRPLSHIAMIARFNFLSVG